jgi:hypothetical protein
MPRAILLVPLAYFAWYLITWFLLKTVFTVAEQGAQRAA